MGVKRTPDTWIVQSPGRFARLDGGVFLDALERDTGLRESARRYYAAVIAVRGQWIACNARHTIEQRLAKWLLGTRDRVGEEIQGQLPSNARDARADEGLVAHEPTREADQDRCEGH